MIENKYDHKFWIVSFNYILALIFIYDPNSLTSTILQQEKDPLEANLASCKKYVDERLANTWRRLLRNICPCCPVVYGQNAENWATRQVDYSNSFAQAELDDDLYVEPPRGFAGRDKKDKVLHLLKSFYGLKQAP